MKKIFLLLVCLLAACSDETASSKKDFTVHAFKVGKADSFLLSQQNEYILIDAGEEDDGKKIVTYLQEQGIDTLKALIITHFDKDHVGGAAHIVNAVDIEHLYVPDYKSNSKQTKKFINAVVNKQLALEKLTEAIPVTLGDATGMIYPPMQRDYESGNDFSLVVSLTFGDTNFLFTGDAEAPRIAELLANPTIKMPHTFLKVPHHGRFNEQTEALFEAVKPSYALITSSNKNPEEDATIKALEAIGTKIFTTRNGDVEFISDKQTITVKN